MRDAAALLVVARVAASSIDRIPQVPAQPTLGVVFRTEIYVLAEGDNRHIDVFRMNGGVLELSQQIVRCGLESIHFAVTGHGARIVERERHTQARIAPCRNRQSTDLDLADADYAEKIGVDDRGAVEGQLRSAGGGVSWRDGDVGDLGPAEQRIKSVRGFGLTLGVGFSRRVL